MDKKITIEFIGKDICDFIEVEEKDLEETICYFIENFLNKTIESLGFLLLKVCYKKYRKVLTMAHCFVEFGAYGAIGDFEVEEGMTEEQILETIDAITNEFVATEIGWVIVENEEDY